jgi:hypothetical protein
VGEELKPVNPSPHILTQEKLQEVEAARGDLGSHILREGNLSELDGLLQLLSVGGYKRREANYELKHDDTNRPEISLISVLLLPLKLRCHVNGCPARSLEKFITGFITLS